MCLITLLFVYECILFVVYNIFIGLPKKRKKGNVILLWLALALICMIFPFFYAMSYPLFFLQGICLSHLLANKTHQQKRRYGFFLGIVTQALHIHWLVDSLYTFATLTQTLAITGILVLTGGCYAAIWLYSLQPTNRLRFILYNSVCTWLYWLTIIYAQFWYTGTCEGNPFANPVLILIQASRFMPGLVGHGSMGLCIWLYMICLLIWIVAYLAIHKNIFFFLMMILLLFLWPKQNFTTWLHQETQIIFEHDLENVQFDTAYSAQAIIAQRIRQRAADQTNMIIVLPESLYQYQVTDEVAGRWAQVLPINSMLLVGAQVHTSQGMHNGVYGITNNGLQNLFFKQHHVACVERKVLFNSFSIRSGCYAKSCMLPSRHIAHNGHLYDLVICSELYYGTYRPSTQCEGVIFVHNHRWLQATYIKNLARAAVALYGAVHNKKIIVG